MKITDKNIAQFLQKYMDGQTSVDEERMLADYFRKHGGKPAPEGIDSEDWQVYREMFAMFEPKLQAGSLRKRHLIAASVTFLLAFGTWQWFYDDSAVPQTTGNTPVIAFAETSDSTATEATNDTLRMEVSPTTLPTTKPVLRKRIDRNRYRDTPPPPRTYLAQASEPADSTTAIDLEEAARQADLLMKAVYVQQQCDINDIMNQYAATVASIDEQIEEEEVYY